MGDLASVPVRTKVSRKKTHSAIPHKVANIRNHRRQLWWLKKGHVMLPTIKEELALRKLVARERSRKTAEAQA